jgi:calcineurin-like phosphoesterase family protein
MISRTVVVVSLVATLCLAAAGTARAGTVVWAVGDAADGSTEAAVMASQIVADDPDRFLYLGDVYPSGTAEDFRLRYHPLYGSLWGRTWPTHGNHEWENRATGYYPYWRPRVTKPYYRVRIGNWELYSLNSSTRSDGRSPQVKWLKRRLAERSGTCRLAFWHRPRYSPGDIHADDPMVAGLWNALKRQARLVVNAHEHIMARMKRRDGISAYISGAGGHTLYGARPDRRAAFIGDRTQGALRMELTRGRATLEFRSATGAVLDRSSLRCKPLRRAPRGR